MSRSDASRNSHRSGDVVAPVDIYPINNLDIEIRLTDPSIGELSFSPRPGSARFLPHRRGASTMCAEVSVSCGTPVLYVASVTIVAVASRRTGCGRPSTSGKHAASHAGREPVLICPSCNAGVCSLRLEINPCNTRLDGIQGDEAPSRRKRGGSRRVLGREDGLKRPIILLFPTVEHAEETHLYEILRAS